MCLCMFVCVCARSLVGVHSSYCGFCEDIGGCHADMHGKGLSWPLVHLFMATRGKAFFLGFAKSKARVHGPAASI